MSARREGVPLPDVEVDIGTAANCKVVSCGQDFDTMGEGALTANILLEGSLTKGIDEALIFKMDEFFCSVKNGVTDGADTNLPRQLSDSSLPYQILWLLLIHCRERERKERG